MTDCPFLSVLDLLMVRLIYFGLDLDIWACSSCKIALLGPTRLHVALVNQLREEDQRMPMKMLLEINGSQTWNNKCLEVS